MQYEFEVFVSYRRGECLRPGGAIQLAEEGRWVHDVFLPDFRARLDHYYPGARLAFDAALPYGATWDPKLQAWLKCSKCMVAIWSPMYFRSKYCRSELHSMLERERALAEDGAGAAPRLVIPLAFADGQWFDDEAKARQWAKDFASFSGFVKPIQHEKRRHAFVRALDRLCEQVCQAIQAAPAWQENFPWVEVEPLPPAHAYPLPSLRS